MRLNEHHWLARGLKELTILLEEAKLDMMNDDSSQDTPRTPPGQRVLGAVQSIITNWHCLYQGVVLIIVVTWSYNQEALSSAGSLVSLGLCKCFNLLLAYPFLVWRIWIILIQLSVIVFPVSSISQTCSARASKQTFWGVNNIYYPSITTLVRAAQIMLCCSQMSATNQKLWNWLIHTMMCFPSFKFYWWWTTKYSSFLSHTPMAISILFWSCNAWKFW